MGGPWGFQKGIKRLLSRVTRRRSHVQELWERNRTCEATERFPHFQQRVSGRCGAPHQRGSSFRPKSKASIPCVAVVSAKLCFATPHDAIHRSTLQVCESGPLVGDLARNPNLASTAKMRCLMAPIIRLSASGGYEAFRHEIYLPIFPRKMIPIGAIQNGETPGQNHYEI